MNIVFENIFFLSIMFEMFNCETIAFISFDDVSQKVFKDSFKSKSQCVKMLFNSCFENKEIEFD